MIVGLIWVGLAVLLTYSPYAPNGTGPTLLIAGNIVIGVALFLWGMAAKGYFASGDGGAS